MPTLPTAAIIGAGSSGIAATKALAERGIDVDCYEASDRVGGNWVFGNRNGMSAAYRDLHINTSRDRMEFSDFPMPRSLPDFPHHTQIAAYFDAYVDHFGLRDRIRFGTAVARAEQAADGTWELTDEHGGREAYDMLLVANGHHWDKRWPEPAFPGGDEFEGVQLHAHDYSDNEFLAGKDVVVLGMGNSAMDIAVESSYVARHTHLAARRGAWIVPKYLFGMPLDQINTTALVPHWLDARVSELIIRLHTGRPERYGLPRPDHRFGSAHPTVSGRILDRISHGTIAPRPNIERLGPDWVQFDDGTRVHADVVIYCTGYRISFPFFDEDVFSAPDNRVDLFRRVFAPGNASLAFVGLLQPLGAIMPLAEAQGRWIAEYLRGEYHLPSVAAMQADIRREQARMRKRYVASKRHTIQVDFDRYLHDLRRERRRGHARAVAAGLTLPVAPRAGAAAAERRSGGRGAHERRRAPRRRAPRGDEGRQPRRDPRRRAGRLRRAGLRRHERARRHPPHGPRQRHVLQLLRRQGVALSRRARAERRDGPRARAGRPPGGPLAGGVRRRRLPRVLQLPRRRPRGVRAHAAQQRHDPGDVRRADLRRRHRRARRRPAHGDEDRHRAARRRRATWPQRWSAPRSRSAWR